MIPKEKISITVPADLRLSNTIRNFVGDLLKIMNVKEVWVNRLILVIDELFMNAVKYGSLDNTDNVFISVDMNDNDVSFCIEDMGTGKEKIAPEDLQKIIGLTKEDASLSKTSGRGLSMIVSNWTNNFKFENSDKGGIKITIQKTLPDIMEQEKDLSQISVSDIPEIAIITFTDKIDTHDTDTEKEIIKNVEDSSKSMFIFDMSSLDYVNSVFIGLLAKLYNILSKRKGRAVIVNTSETIKDTLNLVGLIDILPVVATLEDAKKSLMALP